MQDLGRQGSPGIGRVPGPVEDHEIAVLFAVQNASEHQPPATPPTIFQFLPRVLREKWHEDYLAKIVLNELTRAGCLNVTRSEPGLLCYSLTQAGFRAVR